MNKQRPFLILLFLLSFHSYALETCVEKVATLLEAGETPPFIEGIPSAFFVKTPETYSGNEEVLRNREKLVGEEIITSDSKTPPFVLKNIIETEMGVMLEKPDGSSFFLKSGLELTLYNSKSGKYFLAKSAQEEDDHLEATYIFAYSAIAMIKKNSSRPYAILKKTFTDLYGFKLDTVIDEVKKFVKSPKSAQKERVTIFKDFIKHIYLTTGEDLIQTGILHYAKDRVNWPRRYKNFTKGGIGGRVPPHILAYLRNWLWRDGLRTLTSADQSPWVINMSKYKDLPNNELVIKIKKILTNDKEARNFDYLLSLSDNLSFSKAKNVNEQLAEAMKIKRVNSIEHPKYGSKLELNYSSLLYAKGNRNLGPELTANEVSKMEGNILVISYDTKESLSLKEVTDLLLFYGKLNITTLTITP